MKQLYNEGRVVGLSAYELYVRQMLSRNPEASILSESQWLAASLSTNNSMILKIAGGTSSGYHDYILPEGSDLCGCTCLIGTIFEGSATLDGIWARRVDDYGRLISNTAPLHPETPGYPENVPVKENYRVLPEEYVQQCEEFMKISTGMMFQPGEWVDNVYQLELVDEGGINITTESDEDLLADVSDEITRMSLNVDLSKRGFIRILFQDNIENDFYLFLHGFSYKNILAGMTGFDNLLTTTNPENGDFLGPQSFPWGTRIVFLYNNDMMVMMNEKYTRQIRTIETELMNYEQLVNQKLSVLDENVSNLLTVVPENRLEALAAIGNVDEKVGDLAGLDTTAKQDLVNAINEVYHMVPEPEPPEP